MPIAPWNLLRVALLKVPSSRTPFPSVSQRKTWSAFYERGYRVGLSAPQVGVFSHDSARDLADYQLRPD
jgi:hypothetical protein